MAMEKGKVAQPVENLVRQFEEAEDQGRENREKCQRDRDYYDGYQLTDEEINTLTQRGQPVVVFNRIAPKVDAVLGFERRMRVDPDRKSTRLNSSHVKISYAVFCLK